MLRICSLWLNIFATVAFNPSERIISRPTEPASSTIAGKTMANHRGQGLYFSSRSFSAFAWINAIPEKWKKGPISDNNSLEDFEENHSNFHKKNADGTGNDYLCLYFWPPHSTFWVQPCRQVLQEDNHWWARRSHQTLPKTLLLSGCWAPNPSTPQTLDDQAGGGLESWLTMQCHRQRGKQKNRDLCLRTSLFWSFGLEPELRTGTIPLKPFTWFQNTENVLDVVSIEKHRCWLFIEIYVSLYLYLKEKKKALNLVSSWIHD